MIYKIKMMSGQEIPLESEEALQSFLNEANGGKKLIVTKYGIINVNSIDSVTQHKEKMEELYHELKAGGGVNEVLGPSPFAQLLGPKMTMLSPQSRTELQEDVARAERKIKN